MATTINMAIFISLAIVSITPIIFCLPQPRNHVYEDLPFVTRQQWEARPPVEIFKLNLPVLYVIIHHTYYPEACFTVTDCSASMRTTQDYHQLDLGWEDIGYNFAIGSDGVVYEGRGCDAVGAHTFGFNSKSIGIALIGDWISQIPPQVQMDAAKSLIQEGIKLSYINDTYDLIGHRQAGITECPGQALYEEISTWGRFQPNVTEN